MEMQEKNNFKPQQLIEIGGRICDKIKKLIYPNEKWNMTLANKIAKDFTYFKQKTRVYYPNLNEFNFYHTIADLPDQDYLDILNEFHNAKDGKCEQDPQSDISKRLERSMEIQTSVA
jgi:hypothetical protein